jgi:DNA-binding transcriptional LysR family regulator
LEALAGAEPKLLDLARELDFHAGTDRSGTPTTLAAVARFNNPIGFSTIMHRVNIDGFDLNLLHVFRAVYATRNVSRAAERIGLSQPAVSHALTRLRLKLKDPLFVRAPGGVRPTARAEHFAGFVEAALKTIDVALAEADSFDPATSRRSFAFHMSDLATGELLPTLLPALRRAAPGVRIEALQLDPAAIGGALDEGKIDLAFGYLPELADTHRIDLLEERYVLLLREGHPRRYRTRTRASLEALDFVLVKSHAEPAKALHRLDLESRIRLTIPHFAVLPAILARTDLCAIVPLRPARRYAREGALAIVRPDLGLPPFTIAIHWVSRVHNDPGHRWLRELVQRTLGQDKANP